MNVSRLGVLGAGAAIGTGTAVALYLAIVPAAASAASAAPPPARTSTATSSTSSPRTAAPRVVFSEHVSPAVLEGQDCVTHIQVAAAAVAATPIQAGNTAAVRRPDASRPLMPALISRPVGRTPTTPAYAAAPFVQAAGSPVAKNGTGEDHGTDDHASEKAQDHAPEKAQGPSGPTDATGDGQHPDGAAG